MTKTFVIAGGVVLAVFAAVFGFLVYPLFGLMWLVSITLFASCLGIIELRNRHIRGTVELLQAGKIHADNSALVMNGQIIQLQPGQLGYGTVSNLHTYSTRQELAAPVIMPPLVQQATPILPGPEPTIYQPLTLAETLASLPRNQLAVCFGRDPLTGLEEISDLHGTMHSLLTASTGMGKSSLLAGLLTQLVTGNRPGLFGLYLCDVKRTTGRWFESSANRVAYTLPDILSTVLQVESELKRRMAGLLTDEIPLILCIEEALSTRKMFSKLDDKKEALNLFTGALDNIALLGREYNCFLYWASQVDYASPDINDIKGQFAARLAGSLMPTAAAAMGFQSKLLINQLWQERKPGQFLIESPAGSRIIFTPRLNLKGGELANYLTVVTPPTRERTQPIASDYSAPATREQSNRPVTAQFREINTTAPGYYDALPSASDKLRALSAWNRGANSVRKLAATLEVSEYQARQLIDQLDREGLIIRVKKGV